MKYVITIEDVADGQVALYFQTDAPVTSETERTPAMDLCAFGMGYMGAKADIAGIRLVMPEGMDEEG